MLGLRKLLRALLIVILPMVAVRVFAQASTGSEFALGALLVAFAFGLIATWFWQPH